MWDAGRTCFKGRAACADEGFDVGRLCSGLMVCDITSYHRDATRQEGEPRTDLLLARHERFIAPAEMLAVKTFMLYIQFHSCCLVIWQRILPTKIFYNSQSPRMYILCMYTAFDFFSLSTFILIYILYIQYFLCISVDVYLYICVMPVGILKDVV